MPALWMFINVLMITAYRKPSHKKNHLAAEELVSWEVGLCRGLLMWPLVITAHLPVCVNADYGVRIVYFQHVVKHNLQPGKMNNTYPRTYIHKPVIIFACSHPSTQINFTILIIYAHT